MSQDSVNVLLPDGWEAEGVLGQGAFGTVYRARRVNGSDVEWAAIRHISVPSDRGELDAICTELGTRDPETVNRYLSESLRERLAGYGVMKSLQGQPNIVTCSEIRQYAKKDGPGFDAYIRMELLENLSSRMIDGKTDRDETIRMGMDICRALGVLRSKGLVHRDIRPQTILVNDSGNCLLGGFGTAAGIRDAAAGMPLKGVNAYTSPEIMRRRPAGLTSDIYSLGLVMYRLMNRSRPPFLQQEETGSARKMEEANIRRLSGEPLPKPADADEELGWIILKACAHDPEERWQTPEEMYNALEALGEETVRLTKPFPPVGRHEKQVNPPVPTEPAKPSGVMVKPRAVPAPALNVNIHPEKTADLLDNSGISDQPDVQTVRRPEPFASITEQEKARSDAARTRILICLVVVLTLLLGYTVYCLISGSNERTLFTALTPTPRPTESPAPIRMDTEEPAAELIEISTVRLTEIPPETTAPEESGLSGGTEIVDIYTDPPTEDPAPPTERPGGEPGSGLGSMTIIDVYTDPPTSKPAPPAGRQGSGGGEETAVPPMPIWWDVPNEN